MAADLVPAWFHDTVIDGLTALQTLGLAGAPPAETVTLTATVWINALWQAGAWRGEADATRLSAAFVAVAAKVDRWPAPRLVLDNLAPIGGQAKLPPPTWEPNHEQIDKARAIAAQLRQRMLLKPAPQGYDAQRVNQALRAEEQKGTKP